jgi:hypothetical protein
MLTAGVERVWETFLVSAAQERSRYSTCANRSQSTSCEYIVLLRTCECVNKRPNTWFHCRVYVLLPRCMVDQIPTIDKAGCYACTHVANNRVRIVDRPSATDCSMEMMVVGDCAFAVPIISNLRASMPLRRLDMPASSILNMPTQRSHHRSLHHLPRSSTLSHDRA